MKKESVWDEARVQRRSQGLCRRVRGGAGQDELWA